KQRVETRLRRSKEILCIHAIPPSYAVARRRTAALSRPAIGAVSFSVRRHSVSETVTRQVNDIRSWIEHRVARQEVGATRILSRSRVARQHHVGRLLSDHVTRARDEEAWDLRKDGRVHHTKAARAVHREIACDHAAALLRSDGTGAAGMMSPGATPHELRQ